MFERPHHVRISSVLEALDAAALARAHCYFGGGTAIVLSRGEYRESADLDFLVSDLGGYRALRERLTGPRGLLAIARAGARLETTREVRADQYGIRTFVAAGKLEIKFEVVFESRVALQEPGRKDQVCGVAALTRLDLATTKLLANSDRWADDSVHSRDLIDLAMLGATRPLAAAALEKARGAYGAAVDRDLARAIEQLKRRRGRLEECMADLGMRETPAAVVWQRLRVWRQRLARTP